MVRPAEKKIYIMGSSRFYTVVYAYVGANTYGQQAS